MATRETTITEGARPPSQGDLAAPTSARRVGLIATALALLGIFIVFHLAHLSQTPGWDPQEGYNLDIAWNLTHGRLRLFALTSAFAQHPPLFYLQVALAIHVFGYSVVAVRAVAAFYAILTCAALLIIGRRMLGAGPALWAAAVYTVAPIALANTRWGYSYAQLAFVGLFSLWAAWRYFETKDRRWLLLAAALAGLAAFSDYEGLAWILFVALLAWRLRNWRTATLAAGVGFGVLAAGLLACLLAAPGIFIADIATTFGRAAGGNPLTQLVELLVNYYRFLSLDAWLLLGVVGLFLVPARVRGFLLGAAATLALVILKVRAIGPGIHTLVPLLPLLALGAGVALDLALQRLRAWALGWLAPLRTDTIRRLATTLLIFLVAISPLTIAFASDAVGLSSTLTTSQDTLIASPADAQATISYVLTHTHTGDLVLASPELAWAFDHPDSQPQLTGADLLQTLVQSGQAAAFYPANLPASRWAYNVSLPHARYVIVDNLLRQLATPNQLPAMIPVLAQIERWPIVYQRGQYTVYERPATT